MKFVRLRVNHWFPQTRIKETAINHKSLLYTSRFNSNEQSNSKMKFLSFFFCFRETPSSWKTSASVSKISGPQVTWTIQCAVSYRISEKLSRHAWEVKKRNHVFSFAAGDQVLFVFSHPPVEPETFKRSTIQNHNCNNGGRLVKWNVLAFDLDTLFVLLNQCCIAFL